MKEIPVTFSSGDLTPEGILNLPDGEGPFAAVVVCHPHPLYGGDMNNNVVLAVCRALADEGIASLRFNFRGVGRSQGQYDHGIGEQNDALAAVSFIASQEAVGESLGIAGYSFGAGIALRVAQREERIAAVAAISPGPGMLDLEPNLYDVRPILFVQGSRDTFLSPEKFQSSVESFAPPREVRVIPGADHFWLGREKELSEMVASFFKRAFEGEITS